MSDRIIEAEAKTLNQAKALIRSQVPEGLFILSEEIVSDVGGFAEAVAETTEQALLEAEKLVPKNGEIRLKETFKPGETELTEEADDEETARIYFQGICGKSKEIISIVRKRKPRKGFWGYGRQSGVFSALVRQKTAAKIYYSVPTKIVAKIGHNIRNSFEQIELGHAKMHDIPISVVCENCHSICLALPKPIGSNEIPVMTPEVAFRAARFCPHCRIIICGRCSGISVGLLGSYVIKDERPCVYCQHDTELAAIPHILKTSARLPNQLDETLNKSRNNY